MVFPSVPVYLDPPNWNQQHAHQRGSSGGGPGEAPQLQPGGMAAPHPDSIRPGSMAERARLAKIPQPEPALNCPRCDSTNTKFCYYNNYSLSQPRHFCKTCRRYWTRGGALRNVPVGGGCRRNKRTKSGGGTTSSSSKSSATAAASAGPSSSSSTSSSSMATCARVGGTIPSTLLAPPQLPLMASLHPLGDYGAPNGTTLGFPGVHPAFDAAGNYQQLGAASTSSIGWENWRLQQIQQFPFLGGLEHAPPPPAPVISGLSYPNFEGEGCSTVGGEAGGAIFAGQAHPKTSNAGLVSQLASVKMEDNPRGPNLQRHFSGAHRNDQFWGCGGGGGATSVSGSGWTPDISGFNSSSSGGNNLL